MWNRDQAHRHLVARAGGDQRLLPIIGNLGAFIGKFDASAAIEILGFRRAAASDARMDLRNARGHATAYFPWKTGGKKFLSGRDRSGRDPLQVDIWAIQRPKDCDISRKHTSSIGSTTLAICLEVLGGLDGGFRIALLACGIGAAKLRVE